MSKAAKKGRATATKSIKKVRKKRTGRKKCADITVIADDEDDGGGVVVSETRAPGPAFVLTRNGYGIRKGGDDKSAAVMRKVRQDLTVAPRVAKGYGARPRRFPVYRESSRRIYMPRHYGLQHFATPNECRVTAGARAPRLKFRGALRPLQVKAADKFMATIDGDESVPSREYSHGGILSLFCGAGKTVVALHLAARVGRKTIVVVHKEFLMHQWHARIKAFLPGAKVGVIQQKKADVEGKDIVLAMLQSLSVRDYPSEVMKPFGLVIFDECHHLSSEVFSRCLPKIGARVTLGLSATPTRKDGLTKVFQWFLGPILFKADRPRDASIPALVRVFRLDATNAGYGECLETVTGAANTAAMINNIAEFEPRTALVAALARNVVGTPGRQILVLSGRRKHLDDIHRILTNGADPLDLDAVGYYVGGMSQDSLERSEKCKVVLATFHMAAEGLDIKTLNTLLLATPMSGVTQAVGRILRDVRPEAPPCIIDIVDNYSVFSRQAGARRRVYKKQGFLDVTVHDVRAPPSKWVASLPSRVVDAKGGKEALRNIVSAPVARRNTDYLFGESSDDDD